MIDHGPERRAIRDAMARLLEGAPVRSDGKLTVKSLAEEAGVKRWILTHRHQDLQAEFKERAARHGTDPEPVRALKQRIEDLTVENRRLREQLREARATISMLDRHIAVDALEETRVTPPADGPDSPRLRPVPEPSDPPIKGNQ